MNRSILTLVLALVSAALQTQKTAPTPDPALVRVFVQTDERGDLRDVVARKESVRDLKAAVAAKKKMVVIVDDEDAADVVLEILDRGVTVPRVVIGLGARAGDPTNIPGMNGPVRQVVLRVKLTAREDPIVFTNKNKPTESSRGWKSAADDVGDQVEKWIGAKREEIIKRRERSGTIGKGRAVDGCLI